MKENEMKKEVLGVDIGGVVTKRMEMVGEDSISYFRDRYLEVLSVTGAISSLRKLVDRFEGRVLLVSKAGPETERRTIHWLKFHWFHEQTGIPPENVHYCRTREAKAPICERLGVTHFVDDNLEVLSYLKTVEHQYLFNPIEQYVQKFAHHLPHVERVMSWEELLPKLLKR